MKKFTNKSSIFQVTAYYTPRVGGMEGCVKRIHETLLQKGYLSHVITTDLGINSSTVCNSDKVKRFSAQEVFHTPISLKLFKELFSLSNNSLIHLHVAQAVLPEVVFLASKIKGFSYIVHIHIDVGPSGRMGMFLPIYKKYFLREVLQNAKKVIVLHGSQAQLIQSMYSIPKNKIAIIPNGVEKKFFSTRIISLKKVTKLLFVGRLVSQKNIFYLLQSLQYIKQSTKLDIVGDGELLDSLKRNSLKLNLQNVTFVGKLHGEDLLNAYKSSDILIIPSEREAFPLVALEGLASGLPIIANNTSDLREVLKDHAVFTNVNDSKNFAKEIDNLITDIQRRRLLSKKGQEYARKFRWESVINKVIEVYKSI